MSKLDLAKFLISAFNMVKRGDIKSEQDLIKFAKRSCNAEYVYLYAYGYWYVYSVEDNTYEFVELEDEIAVIGIK